MRKKSYRITITTKILLLQILLCSIGLFLGFSWRIYNENRKWDHFIYPGIKVANFDLGGKTKEEAKKLVKSYYAKLLLDKRIKIVVNGRDYFVEYSKLISSYNFDCAVDKAFNWGKHLILYRKYKLIKQGADKKFSAVFTYNDKYIDEFSGVIAKAVLRNSVNANIKKIPGRKIHINADIRGRKLQKGKFEECIKNKVDSGNCENININTLIEETKASITVDKLSCINTSISSFNTSFVSSSYERSHNIGMATKLINGKLLMPGEVFSFNDCVGERTKARGFMEASVITNGKIDSGFGGGICQVSSTLYNAILRAGIKPLERTHHTLPSSYVGVGFDATVNWKNIDLKFKNTLNYPMYIEAYTCDKHLYVNIYSSSNLTKKKYIVTNNIYEIIRKGAEPLKNSKLNKGKTFTLQRERRGYRVRVIRNTYENGVLINSEVISNDFYAPLASNVKKGVNVNRR